MNNPLYYDGEFKILICCNVFIPMLILFLEFGSILCNKSMYIDYFHIQSVFDLVMDLWKKNINK